MHIIANFTWGACSDCKHCDPKEGGCGVDNDQWKDDLIIESDFVVCGSWESQESSEPLPQNQGPALPGLEV